MKYFQWLPIRCLKSGTLRCDAPLCDYRKPDVLWANLIYWVNIPCPQCGAMLLTPEDYLAFTRHQRRLWAFNLILLPVWPLFWLQSLIRWLFQRPSSIVRVGCRGDGQGHLSLTLKPETKDQRTETHACTE